MADDILNVIDGKRDALCDLLAAPYPHGQAKLPSKYHIGCVEEGIAAIDLATAEIERLRAAGERLNVALLVTSNVWGRQHQSDDDAKYHRMVDVAVDAWKEARRG